LAEVFSNANRTLRKSLVTVYCLLTVKCSVTWLSTRHSVRFKNVFNCFPIQQAYMPLILYAVIFSLWIPRVIRTYISKRTRRSNLRAIKLAQSQTDAIIGWVDRAGRPFLMDTWINGYTAPQLDSSQDLSNITGNTADGLTTLSFMRKRSTGDTKVSGISFRFQSVQRNGIYEKINNTITRSILFV